MLVHPTLDKLRTLKLTGMLRVYQSQLESAQADGLNFDERFTMITDGESIERENGRAKNRLSKAKLRQPACIEDIDFRQSRGLDKATLRSLAACQWIRFASETQDPRGLRMVRREELGHFFFVAALAVFRTDNN